MPEAKLSVGNVDISVLTDMDVTLPLNQMFPDVPLEDWAPYQQRYPGAFSGGDAARIHMGGFLLRSQGRTILVDTATAEPPDEPPQVRSGLNGFPVAPNNRFTVLAPMLDSGIFVFPRIMPPARRIRLTIPASNSGTLSL